VPKFETVSRFQAVERDIAVLVSEQITHYSLMRAIWSAPSEGVLRDAVLFDIYRPKLVTPSGEPIAPPEKSMAVRLTLNSEVATLSEQQIEAAVAAVVKALADQVGARQRV
jgi:phenylalanyl-tRNA synthetase beta chain